MDEIKKLNKKHAVVQYGGQTLILNEEYDEDGREKITFSKPSDFKERYSNITVFTNKGIEKLGKVWMENQERRQYDGVYFNPKGVPSNYYNLFKGFKIKSIAGDCNLYLDHIYNIIASGDKKLNDYILDFMADAIQNPGSKPGVSLVLRGDQGVGKGIFVKYFGKLFDPYFVEVTNSNHFLGNFNSILESKLLVFADESFWAGDKKAEGILKGLITEDYLNIERKGKDVIRSRNFIRLIIASNNNWVIPAMANERRFCVMDVSNSCRQDTKYFKAIIDQMDNGGLEALMHFLINRDISKTNIRNFPKTNALTDQKLHSMTSLESWWYDCLNRGYIIPSDYYDQTEERFRWEDPTPVSHVYESMIKSSKSRGIKSHLSEAQFGKELKSMVPNVKKSKGTVYQGIIEEPSNFSMRKNRYIFPPLDECRQYFDEIMSMKTNWPEV